MECQVMVLQWPIMIVAIQGQAGSFHEQVAQQWYGGSVEILPCTTFSDVFSAYTNGEVDAIVTAIENTIYGSINEVYQLIEDCEAPIVGEVTLNIEQLLIGYAGTPLSQITEVYSHPVALGQCRHWLQKHLPGAELIEFFDTAGAVEYVKTSGNPHMAAIAGEQAAQLYNMAILHRSIQDSNDNITRFVVLEPTDTPKEANKASFVVTTNHRPGALVEVLQVFSQATINIATLQSQPIIGKPWQYKFFITVDTAGDNLYSLIEQIENGDHQVTLLGEYVAA